MKIETELMTEITISRFQRLKPVVDFSPPYQREGGVWKERTKAILIDSIINGLDVPKLYFEAATKRIKGPSGLSYQYAVIDGKQRLEAIGEFHSGALKLDENFRYFRDESIAAGGMTLSELAETYPELSRRFLDFEIPIVLVTTDSDDLIDEMFQRLNASSSINAAERRNAVPGQTRISTNELAKHPLLANRSPIRNARYKYRELASKFLAVEDQIVKRERVSDTKASTLYELFTATRDTPQRISDDEMTTYQESVAETLDRMAETFIEDDWLLASVGTVVVYYLAFRDASFAQLADRAMLSDFEELRREASRMDDRNPEYSDAANARLREYNSKVQSTNDGAALTRRVAILRRFVEGYTDSDHLAGLRTILADDPPDTPDDDEL